MRSISFCKIPSEYGWRVGKSLMSSTWVAEHRRLRRPALGQEPVGDPALIEHLDRARVKAAGARAGQDVIGAPLDDHDVDLRQGQLGRQHHPRRTASGDHHLMVGHTRPPECPAAEIAPHRPAPSVASGRAAGDYGAADREPHEALGTGINWKWRGIATEPAVGDAQGLAQERDLQREQVLGHGSCGVMCVIPVSGSTVWGRPDSVSR